jgi:hypothetical protein
MATNEVRSVVVNAVLVRQVAFDGLVPDVRHVTVSLLGRGVQGRGMGFRAAHPEQAVGRGFIPGSGG